MNMYITMNIGPIDLKILSRNNRLHFLADDSKLDNYWLRWMPNVLRLVKKLGMGYKTNPPSKQLPPWNSFSILVLEKYVREK